MAARRFRLGFKFWLNIENPQEEEVAEEIEQLKASRSFTRTIRDGIRLVCDLRRGRTDVLQELFPWVLAQTPEEESTPADDRIQVQLARLEQLLLQQGALPVEGKPSQAPIPMRPPHSEIQITVKEAKHDENNRSDWNFTIASALMVYGHCDGLPPEIIEYGIRTGRIKPAKQGSTAAPPSKAPPRQNKASPKTPAKKPADPRAMDVPQFAPPSFDDFDDGFS